MLRPVDRCDECGFDPETVTPVAAPDGVRDIGRKWQAPLTRFLHGEDGDTLVRVRPAPGAWSAIELAAHLRDVLGLFDRRVHQIVETDNPVLEIVEHDAVVRHGDYNALPRVQVLAEIQSAATTLASTFATLPEPAWSRTGTRDGAVRTPLELAQRAVHEGRHHLLDAGRALRAARGRA